MVQPRVPLGWNDRRPVQIDTEPEPLTVSAVGTARTSSGAPMSTPIRWLLGVVGLLLIVGAPAMWLATQPAGSAGELPESFIVEADEAPAEPVSEIGEAHSGADDLLDADDGVDGVADLDHDPASAPDEPLIAEPATSARPPKPVSVSLPALGVDAAAVVEVGLDANRAVEIPDDVREVGWYGKGPRPGEDGNAFMTSHVDSRTQGRGVLFDLRRSEPGDPIVVTHEDGSVSEWTVVARERIRKGSYPMDQVFRFDGPPGLVIDTCGGAFDADRGSYEQIDIVYAVPADAAPGVADAG
jgi:hypothetical protein